MLIFIILAFTQCQKNTNISFPAFQNFNDDWEFTLSTDSVLVFSGQNNDIPWQKVKLPHIPVIEPLIVNEQWQGICWYRKRFTLPENCNDRLMFLRFEGAMNVADVWINGIKKTTHLGGYLPFVVEFTGEAIHGGINEVIVRLDNRDNPVTGPKPLKLLDFNMYGGLYRDVFLISKHPLHITDPLFEGMPGSGGLLVTYPVVSSEKAVVRIQAHIRNRTAVDQSFWIHHEIWRGNRLIKVNESAQITTRSGEVSEVHNDLEVPGPELWYPSSPSLYQLVTHLVTHQGIVDHDTIMIGIRRFDIRKDHFAVNGREMFLRGVNRHQEYPYIGYALSNDAQYRDALKIKEAGFDYVRLSHYPHSPAFMDACDQLGLLVLDAIPGWQYFTEDTAFQSHAIQTCRDMIRRDRNHPCVLAWEVSLNESWMSEEFIDKAVKAAREEYPTDQCFTAGWQEYGYDIYLQARQHRLQHYHEPEKPYIVSEYGDWEYYALNAGFNQEAWGNLLEEQRWSRQLLSAGENRLLQQATNIQEAHNDNFNTPAFADGYWVMFDYNRGYADDLESSGIMSIDRIPKFSYYFFQSQRDATDVSADYDSGPMVYIASYWNDQSSLDVRVFSNCEEVELLLNGNPAGRQKPDTGRMCGNLTHPPFTYKLEEFRPGTLLAVGYIGNEPVARHQVMTPEQPIAIRMEYDESGRPPAPGVNDGIFVYASLVDREGTIVPLNDKEIEFSLAGDAELVSPAVIRTTAGIASALVMIGATCDKIELTARYGSVTTGRLVIPVREAIGGKREAIAKGE